MVSVTGRTVASIDALLDEMLVSVSIDSLGQLIYQKRSGEEVNAGSLTNAALAVEKAYPINSLYISTVPTNPGDAGMLGIGTWIRFGKGRTLISQDDSDPDFNTTGNTGGEKTHALSLTEMPGHVHNIDHDHPNFNSGPGSAHSHDIAVKYRSDIDNSGGDGQVIGGVGGFVVGTAPGSGTGTTSAESAHFHAINVPPLGTYNSGASGSSTLGTGDAHNNMSPYIVVYIWKRTA